MEELEVFRSRREREEERRKERSHHDVRDEVFDRRTLLAISRLVSRDLLQQVDFSISTGKVANVFRVTSADGPRALKVYRVGNAVFRSMPPYLLHDLREEVGSNSFGRLVFAWARREFMALKKCREADVPVPEPIEWYRNLLLMSFVGKDGLPFPTLIKSEVKNPEKLCRELCTIVRKMTRGAELVHGDLSPYNLLYDGRHLTLIDMGESLPVSHPQAAALLRRDAANFAHYFGRLGLTIGPDELFAKMGGDRFA